MANQQQIAALSRSLNQVVTHPEFIGLIEELERQPEDRRKQFIRERMNAQALAARGIPTPQGLRSVVRVFENPQSAVITSEAVDAGAGSAPGTRVEELAAGDTTVCTSFGIGLCVSVGQSVPQ
jgi:hypothetical protein